METDSEFLELTFETLRNEVAHYVKRKQLDGHPLGNLWPAGRQSCRQIEFSPHTG